MDIIYHTNIDRYKTMFSRIYGTPSCTIPRKGEHVEVEKVYHHGLATRKLPIRLQVVDVTYKESYVEVELHFDPLDVELWKDADRLSMFER
jgi:hypothetical protein